MKALYNFHRLIIWAYLSTSLYSMVIHYRNYKNGVNPTYLLVFKMMALFVPPKTVGLTDKSQILWLTRRARFIAFAGYLNVSSIQGLVIFGLPNSFFLCYLGFLLYEIQLYQLSYFYIICIFLKFKLQSINAKLLEKKSKTSIEGKVGFTCWKLFTINYFRCYEVSLIFIRINHLDNYFYFFHLTHFIYYSSIMENG